MDLVKEDQTNMEILKKNYLSYFNFEEEKKTYKVDTLEDVIVKKYGCTFNTGLF
jgi:hypothetical protein